MKAFTFTFIDILRLLFVLDANNIISTSSFQFSTPKRNTQNTRHLRKSVPIIPQKLHLSSAASSNQEESVTNYGELERLKQEEQHLAALLASVREQKLAVIRERPLKIGIVGFGRFGQFIARSFTKYGHVVGTSRSDYTALAEDMGAKYIPMSDIRKFVVEEDLDVIVLAVSIVSFDDTVKELVPHLVSRMERKGVSSCPLIVDVLSVKEHPRKILLDNLPEECDVLCTHPVRLCNRICPL